MACGFGGDAGAGMCRWNRRMILLDIRLSRAEECCMLGHEIVLAERGSFPRWSTVWEEAAIPLDTSGEALA